MQQCSIGSSQVTKRSELEQKNLTQLSISVLIKIISHLHDHKVICKPQGVIEFSKTYYFIMLHQGKKQRAQKKNVHALLRKRYFRERNSQETYKAVKKKKIKPNKLKPSVIWFWVFLGCGCIKCIHGGYLFSLLRSQSAVLTLRVTFFIIHQTHVETSCSYSCILSNQLPVYFTEGFQNILDEDSVISF